MRIKSASRPGDYEDDGAEVWVPNLQGNSGSAHSVSSVEREKTAVQMLREVVAEVTSGRIPVPERRGPRF